MKKAYQRFKKALPDDFADFCEKNSDWLEDYALFMALKDANGGVAWFEWKKDLKLRKPSAIENAKEEFADAVEFWKMLQYLFFKQWTELKAYANEKVFRLSVMYLFMLLVTVQMYGQIRDSSI